MRSLCETCAHMRAVITPKGSRFLLCERSKDDSAFPKYPPQPVGGCDGYRPLPGVLGLDSERRQRAD